MKTDCNDSVAAAKLTLSCSRQQASTTPRRCRQWSSVVETDFCKLRPGTLNMASVRADPKGHASRLAEDANDPILGELQKRMPHTMHNTQCSPVVHELKRRGVLSSANGAKYKEVGRTDAFTKAESVSMLNSMYPLASPRAAQRSPRTRRRNPDLGLRCNEDRVNEKPSESSLQSPQKSIRRHSVDPPRSVARAGCTFGMSVTKHSKTLQAAPSGVGGLPMNLLETAPVRRPPAVKSSCSRPANPRFLNR